MSDGYAGKDPEVVKARSRAYYHAHRDEIRAKQNAKNATPDGRQRQRAFQLRKKFGISQEDYDRLLASQDGKCAICGSPDPKCRWGVFSVDHDHKAGKVRGLLCAPCNLGLGNLQDDPEVLLRAAAYLRKHQE